MSISQATTPMKRLGIAALMCYGIHASYHLYNGRPQDLLWACHIGAALIGVGLLANSTTISSVGALQLCMGTPLWILDLLGGGEFMPTSVFTHVVALCIGLYSIRRFGIAKRAGLNSIITLIALILLCRLITPAKSNVNIAFSIQPGYEEAFPSYPVYIGTMIAISGLYFLGMEYAMRRWLVKSQSQENEA